MLRRVKLLKVNYTFRLLDPGFVATFKLVPVSNKLLALSFYPSGAVTYVPASAKTKIFALSVFKPARKVLKGFDSSLTYSIIRFAPLFRKISNIELFPGRGMQYARSAGCYGIITRCSTSTHTAVVRLPSGVRKIFSVFSVLSLAPSALK